MFIAVSVCVCVFKNKYDNYANGDVYRVLNCLERNSTDSNINPSFFFVFCSTESFCVVYLLVKYYFVAVDVDMINLFEHLI